MFRKSILAAAIAAAFAVPASAFAADDAEIGKIRDEIKELKDGYENRIRSLEELRRFERGHWRRYRCTHGTGWSWFGHGRLGAYPGGLVWGGRTPSFRWQR